MAVGADISSNTLHVSLPLPLPQISCIMQLCLDRHHLEGPASLSSCGTRSRCSAVHGEERWHSTGFRYGKFTHRFVHEERTYDGGLSVARQTREEEW